MPPDSNDALVKALDRFVEQQSEFRKEIVALVSELRETQRIMQTQIWLLFGAVGSIAIIFLLAIVFGGR